MMTAEQLKASILQLAMEGKLVEQRPEEGTGEELYRQIQTQKAKRIKEHKIKKQKLKRIHMLLKQTNKSILLLIHLMMNHLLFIIQI